MIRNKGLKGLSARSPLREEGLASLVEAVAPSGNLRIDSWAEIIELLLASAASAAVFAVATATAASATTAFSAENLGGLFNLLQRSFAVLVYRACELQGFACERVVEVDGYFGVCNLDDCAVEMVAFAVHERHFCAEEDVLVVELAVDLENLTCHRAHQGLVALAESLGRLQGEVELLAGRNLGESLLEGFNHQAHVRDKCRRARSFGFVEQLVRSGCVGEHLVAHLEISLCHVCCV